MRAITPTLLLRCQHCDWRPPADAVVEAVALHNQVEHDTDKYELAMVAVCTCGAEMVHTGTTNGPSGELLDHFLCTFDNIVGLITRRPT